MRFAVLMLIAAGFHAQAQTDTRAVAGGGISVPGWSGKIDANEEKSGMTLNSAKLAKEGDALHGETGMIDSGRRDGECSSKKTRDVQKGDIPDGRKVDFR